MGVVSSSRVLSPEAICVAPFQSRCAVSVASLSNTRTRSTWSTAASDRFTVSYRRSSMRPKNISSAPACFSRATRAGTSSTTAFTSTSSIENDLHYTVRIREVLENRVRLVLQEIFHGVVSGRDADCAGADRFAAADVGGSVANDINGVTRELASQHVSRAALCHAGKLRPVLVVRAERVDVKARHVHAGRRELHPRAGLDVPREQPEGHVVPGLERVEQ